MKWNKIMKSLRRLINVLGSIFVKWNTLSCTSILKSNTKWRRSRLCRPFIWKPLQQHKQIMYCQEKIGNLFLVLPIRKFIRDYDSIARVGNSADLQSAKQCQRVVSTYNFCCHVRTRWFQILHIWNLVKFANSIYCSIWMCKRGRGEGNCQWRPSIHLCPPFIGRIANFYCPAFRLNFPRSG